MNKILFLIFINITLVFASNKCFEKGQLFEKMHEYNNAISAYLEGANKGVVNCMIQSAMHYSNEENKIVYNPDKAFELLTKASVIEPYNSLIHYNLGIYYFKYNKPTQDKKARYHFVLALLLGDKDAKEYIGHLYQYNSSQEHLALILDKQSFKIETIAKRINLFSNKKIKVVSKDVNKIILESSKGFKYKLFKDRVELTGILNKYNALSFGETIKFLQYGLYVDTPKDLRKITDKTMDYLISELTNNKLSLNKGFKDNFEHTFEFSSYIAPLMKYTIKLKE